jgi:hypothetical protein
MQITGLPASSAFGASDVLAIEINGVTYKITGATLAAALQSMGDYVVAQDIANNLTTTDEGYVLDARQGKALLDALEAIGASDVGAVAVDQGAANAGKALVVGPDGTVTTGDAGIPEAVKESLLQLVRHVVYTDDKGQSYYDALAIALNGDEVTSLSAVYSPGSFKAYEGDALDLLRPYLTVTATYYSGNTETVQNYTLSGTLVVGTQTITAEYMGKTATFTVTVYKRVLYDWDFTQSMTDSVSGAVAETTAQRDSNGLTFTELDTYLDLGRVYSRDRTYEIDVDYINAPLEGSAAYRRFFAFGSNGTDTQRNTTGLVVAMSTYRPGWYWYLGSAWDSAAIGPAVSTVDSYGFFNGKTVKIYIDSSGYGHVYAKTIGAEDSAYVEIGSSHGVLNDYDQSTAHVYIGSSASDRMAPSRIKAIRVYGGEK